MLDETARIPLAPRAAALPLSALPLGPLSLSLTMAARRMAANHPSMFRRLGEHDRKTFALDPTDLPITLVLDAGGGRPKVTAHRRPPPTDARIAGPMAALIGLVHGAYDGDALFFSRDLAIEGDTAAALALRNAVDDAEIDLSEEAAGLAGPLGRPLRVLARIAERATGVPFTRPAQEIVEW